MNSTEPGRVFDVWARLVSDVLSGRLTGWSRSIAVMSIEINSPLISPLDGRASFDTSEVAQMTGLSPKTLRKYASLGYIAGAFQPGGKRSGWRFKRKELEVWWQSLGVTNHRGRKNRFAPRGA